MSASSPPSNPSRRTGRDPRIAALVAGAVAVVLLVVAFVLPMLHAVREQRAEVLATNAQVTASQTAEILEPGGRACVRRIDVPEARVDVRVFPGFAAKVAPALRITVRGRDGAVLARGAASGYANAVPVAVHADVGRPRRDTTVCVQNAGRSTVTLAHAVLPQEGRVRLPIRVDVTTRPYRTLERFPVALTRASFFKSSVVSRPLIALLFVAVLALAAVAVGLVLRGRRGRDGDA